jgi:hypothetical protein
MESILRRRGFTYLGLFDVRGAILLARGRAARDHRRVAKDRWRAGEVVEESSSGAKKTRRDVDVDFVEEFLSRGARAHSL